MSDETIDLRSPAFDDHAPINRHYARDGDNASPALEWSGVPDDAAELAILCEDPDAPSGTFTHWAVAGVDPGASGVPEGSTPSGAVEGTNDFGDQGYGGPQPPVGDPAHRYFFRVFALREPLHLEPGFSPDELRRALPDKELAAGVLVGTYER